MCGIAGIVSNSTSVQDEHLRSMVSAMKHRGPDGDGTWINEDTWLGLAHARLSILDLSEQGSQPMFSHDGRFVMSFNGEVFNFVELKRDLESLGYKFSSDSDTEVILASFEEWDIECFDRFNGMWAIAIYDTLKKKLVLSRDRYGIKPLYLFRGNTDLWFASETNAFWAVPGLRRELDEANVQLAMSHSAILEGKCASIFRNVESLPPGHVATIEKGGPLNVSRWYSVLDGVDRTRQAISNISYSQRVEQFKELLDDACRIRMRSDVNMATALSGGLDSSSLFSTVLKLQGSSALDRLPDDFQRAFIAIFPGTEQDETEFAKSVLDYTGGEGVFVEMQHDNLADRIVDVTKHFETLASSPQIALTEIYASISNAGFKISVDGHGVDEALYGYRGMVSELFENSKWNGNKEDSIRYARMLSSMYAEDQIDSMSNRFLKEIEDAAKSRSSIRSRISSLVKSRSDQNDPFLSPAYTTDYDLRGRSLEEQVTLKEFTKATLPELLRNFDKAAMMSSIEIRMPFMDYRLVEFMLALPLEEKLHDGFTKRILRDAMKDRLPEKVRKRKYKVGLQSPLISWFNGPLNNFGLDMIQSIDSANRESLLKKLSSKTVEKKDAYAIWRQINHRIISTP